MLSADMFSPFSPMTYIWQMSDCLHVVGDSRVKAPYTCLDDFGLDNFRKRAPADNPVVLTPLHKAIGPNIEKGNDVIIVGDDTDNSDLVTSRENRLLAYTLPVWNNVRSKTPWCGRPSGPRLIVLTLSRNSVSKMRQCITYLCSMECNRGLHIPINYMYSWKLGNSNPIAGDVLITTITAFKDLLEHFNKEIFRRLDFLVFDESDRYNTEQWELLTDVMDIAHQHHKLEKRRSHVSVISSSKWTNRLDALYHVMRSRNSTHVYFESILEIYNAVKATWNVFHVKQAEGENSLLDQSKLMKVFDIIPSTVCCFRKIVVGCSTQVVAEKIQHYLQCYMHLKCTIFHPGATGCIGETPIKQPKIVILPDESFHSQSWKSIEPFDWLISFDGDRMKQLCYLRKCWPRMLPLEESSNINLLEATFLCTGEEDDFLEFYKFCKPFRFSNIDVELKETGEQLLKEENDNRPFCDSMQLFGYCIDNESNTGHCVDRHVFNAADVAYEPYVSVLGEIEFKVAICHSPSEYTCVLYNQYIIKGGKEILLTSFEQEREEFLSALAEVPLSNYSKPVLGEIRYGYIYCMWMDKLERMVAGKLFPRESTPNEIITLHNHAYFQTIDTGEKLLIKTKDLYSLPDSPGITLPVPCIKVILSNICPLKREGEYDELEIKHAQQLVKITDATKFRGKVRLSMNATVWISQMISTEETKDSMKVGLKDKVQENPTHLTRLIELAKSMGTQYSENRLLDGFGSALNITSEAYHSFNDPVQWRHLDISQLNSVEVVRIRTTYAYNPWQFYGICREFELLLHKLRTDLEKWATGDVYGQYNVCETWFMEDLRHGDVVTVRVYDGKNWSWERGLIVNKMGDIKTGFSFDAFLVDDGETCEDIAQSDVKPILKNLVSRLPFQAIAMSLSHVQPNDETCVWDDTADDEFIQLVIPNCECVYINVVAMSEITDEPDIPCKLYDIIGLLERKELGDLLIKKNVARLKTDMREWVVRMNKTLRAARRKNVSTTQAVNCGTFSELSLNDFDVYLGPDFPKILPTSKNNGKNTTQPLTVGKDENRIMNEAQSQGINKSESERSAPTPLVAKNEKKLFRFYPTVVWHQTKTHIYLTVKLEDIVDYKFIVEEDKRTITLTITKPANYGFQIKLYGKVLNDANIKLTGQRMELSLKKLFTAPNLWPRISYDKKYIRWLKPNIDRIEDDDSDTGGEQASYQKTTVGSLDHVVDSDASTDHEDKLFVQETFDDVVDSDIAEYD